MDKLGAKEMVAQIDCNFTRGWHLARLAYILGHSLFGATRLASVLTTVVGVGVGATAFVLMLWWTALLEEAEWDALPKGRQIYQFINRGRK